MKIIGAMIFLLLLGFGAAINQTCTLIQPCPANAGCSPLTNYCVCDPGFIGSCNTKADSLAQYPELIELNPYTRQFFFIKPIELEQFIEITITICREKDKENVPVSLSVWVQNGTIEEYLPSNTLNHPVQLSFESQCRTHILKFAHFGVQPNGESQMLVLGLSDNQHKTILSLTAQQRLVQGVNFYYYIMVGLIVFIIVLSIVSGLTLLMRRRRWMGHFREQGYTVDDSANLDHFEVFMPSLAAGKQTEKLTCPICLQNFEPKEEVRNTPCQHLFHTICLDSWCVAHLSCPVCRSDFSLQKIAEIGKSSPRREGEGKRQPMELEEGVQIQLERREKDEGLRRHILE